MKRFAIQALRRWRHSKPHKPIIMRGARQVGKTTLAELFGSEFEHFVSINLEKDSQLISIFDDSLDPERLIKLISIHTGQLILPGKTLLFIDEIQEAPRAITALRYFYEEMPELHVIAAGSLLDFAIEQVGVPVGRINFLYVYPLSFMEFLLATNRAMVVEEIVNHQFPHKMEEMLHKKFLECLGEYLAIGGMPEAVQTWSETQDLHACQLIHQSILQTYRQDFAKYAKKHQIKYLELLFQEVCHQATKRFTFSKIPGEYRKRELAPALELLEKAGLVKRIYYSASQGIPLEAQSQHGTFKCIFVDIALAQALLGYDLRSWIFNAHDAMINKGEITEMFVGQEILAYANSMFEKRLYYWEREVRGSQAEIDYVWDYGQEVIPIEVKSGTSKKLKSMYSFLEGHPKSPYGIRFSPLPYAQEGKIHTYPLYAIASLLLQRELIENHA